MGPLPGATAPFFGRRPVDFRTLLAQADVISLHVPLDDTTNRMLGAAEMASMKPGSVLINTARGGIVDESALKSALEQGPLAAAAYRGNPEFH